jgi:hypothetical protein
VCYQRLGDLQPEIKAQVAQATGGHHHQVVKGRAMVAEDLVDDPEDLDTADAVFDPDAFAGDRLIRFLFGGGEFTAAWFLLGLVSRRAEWLIALEAGIFLEPTAGREEEGGLIHGRFIMLLALTSRTQGLDFAGAFGGDDDILDRVALLLATVVLALAFSVFRTLDRAFRAVDDERQVGTGGQDLCYRGGLLRWQLLFVAQGLVQDRSQPVNPGAGLPLADPKEETLGRLRRIHTEVEQDEDQFVGHGG